MLRPAAFWALVPLVIACAACETDPRTSTPPPPPREGPLPESEQWGATIRLFEEGMTQAVIDAVHVAVYGPAVGHTRLDTLDADLYDDQGEASSRLTALAGEIYDQEREGRRRVKTWGNVVLRGAEGRVVRADTLWWDEAGDRVYTDGPVEVTRDGDILRGIGFEGDSRLEHFTIQRASGISEQGGRWLRDETRPPPPDTGRAVPPPGSR